MLHKLSNQELDSMARPLPHCRLVYSGLTQANTGVPVLFGYYDKIFGAMYGLTFDLDSSNATIEELLQDVVGIIDVSKYLGCIHAVAHTINAALLGQGQVLWRSVQANPFAWVDLAMRVRSVAVFSEAIIHLVGRWNSLSSDQKAGLEPKVRKICEQKVQELQIRLTHIECRVLKFYPAEITRPIGAPPKHIQRMSYANDIYTWMALCLFRHWFASALAVNQNRHATDGGFWLYSKLAKGGDAYLEKSEVNKFHDKFPMSTRGEHVLDQTVNRLKEMIRPIVAELMRTEANLDQERFPVEYLTCTVIKKEQIQALLGRDDNAIADWSSGDHDKLGEKRKKKQSKELQLEEQLWGDEESDELEMVVKKKSKMGNRYANGVKGVNKGKSLNGSNSIETSISYGSASESDEGVSDD
jgi:hypothetical protein